MSGGGCVLYFPHGGGPLPLLEDPGHLGMNRFLRTWPQRIERPDAIVVVSAHWEAPVVSITASPAPDLLFDYYGFPPQTYDYEYPAPGEPELAARIHDLLLRAGIDAHLDQARGFDHGLFVPLMLMYPQADIPCVQVSLLESLDAAEHLRVGRALAELARENLLILGSGFSFHNLGAIMAKSDGGIDPRNRAFEDWLAETLCEPGLDPRERETRLVQWHQAPHARYCHPREEHLLPLQVCFGIGQRAATRVFHEPVAGFFASAFEWRDD